MTSRVVLVEDHVLLVQSLTLALRMHGVAAVPARLTSEAELMASVAADAETLVLLDLDLGEPLVDGVGLVPAFVERGARVLVVTGTNDVHRIAAAIEAGAVGYVHKERPVEVLLDAVLRATRGERVLSEPERQELLMSLRRHRAEEQRRLAPFRALTRREQLVLDALAAGKSVEQIAVEFVVSEATIRSQVRGVLTKLDVSSQLAAVARAQEAGWHLEG